MNLRFLAVAALFCAPAILSAQSPPEIGTRLFSGPAERLPHGLSPAETEALRTGYDMGGARSAETAGIPSPERAIELRAELDLSTVQVDDIMAIRAVMLDNAQRIGNEIVAKEARLDSLFSNANAHDWTVRPLVIEIGKLHTELRYVFLHARMRMADVLSEMQRSRYLALVTERSTQHADHVDGE